MGGIALLSSFYLFNTSLGNDNSLNKAGKIIKQALSFLPCCLADVLSELSIIILGVCLLYCFCSGIYRIITFRIYINEFEGKTPGGIIVKENSSYPNINRILNYRESKLAGMSSERAAELYIQTSAINALYSGYYSGAETKRTLSYIESKLSGMSGERALSYLTNKL
jgi:hypothetical protein